MSRVLGSPLRPVAVWLLVTGTATVASTAVPAAWASTRTVSGTEAVSALVVAACATALAAALGWLWLITTTTVLGLLRGRTPTRGTTRRLVLLACGVAVVAATTTPSVAADDGRELLDGLSLPERAVAPVVHRTAATAPADVDIYVVRPGDSLSSIALAHPGTGSLDARWRAIWRANRDVVGDDPDLILPGQALRLPGTTDRTHQDGDPS